MTHEELMAAIEAPAPEGEEFELAENVVLKLAPVVSWNKIQRLAKEVDTLKMMHPAVTVGEETFTPTDDEIDTASFVAACCLEPKLSVKDALKISGRYGMQYGHLLRKITDLSNAATTAVVEDAKKNLGLNPSEPGA